MDREGNPYSHMWPPTQTRKGKKRKVAKDGAKRGSVEGLIFFALTQLVLSGSVSPELAGFITEENVGIVVGFAALMIRIGEALIQDGKEES